jgi:hypothetical protein
MLRCAVGGQASPASTRDANSPSRQVSTYLQAARVSTASTYFLFSLLPFFLTTLFPYYPFSLLPFFLTTLFPYYPFSLLPFSLLELSPLI